MGTECRVHHCHTTREHFQKHRLTEVGRDLWKLYWGAIRKKRTDSLARVCCDRTRGNGFKLKKGGFRLHIRKQAFTIRVARHWSRLPSEVMDAMSPETFKVRLEGALSNPVEL